MESKIKACKAFIGTQEKIQREAMEKGLKLLNPVSIKTSMRTANFARESVVKKSKELMEYQDQIKFHMAKKPKRS